MVKAEKTVGHVVWHVAEHRVARSPIRGEVQLPQFGLSPTNWVVRR